LTTSSFKTASTVDMIWCCEVVEHIEEKFIGNLFDTFKNANIIVMTFGKPGQTGWHHVNCQPKEYWIEKMNGNGFDFLETDTKISSELVPALSHYGKTGLIFRRKEK
jgi:hypothetical protein